MKKTVKVVLPILLGVLIAVVLLGSLVTTRPNEYTIVKQFGKVVRVIDQPGLSLKTPFVQSTSTLPKTEMLYDLAASDVITSDKKSMVADSFVLWRIVDPLKFIQTLSGSVSGAEARLDQAVYNSLKTVISSMKQEDVISGRDGELARAHHRARQRHDRVPRLWHRSPRHRDQAHRPARREQGRRLRAHDLRARQHRRLLRGAGQR